MGELKYWIFNLKNSTWHQNMTHTQLMEFLSKRPNYLFHLIIGTHNEQ